MFTWLLAWFFKESIKGASFLVRGLLDHVSDSRDFRYSDLGGCAGYTPKQSRLELPVLEVKNQLPNNTCVFHSYASCRENDEGVPLSPRSLVLYAKQKGYLSSNGISSIRNGQRAGLEFGIAEEKVLPNDNLRWQDYAGIPITPEIALNAKKHKPNSTFWVKTKDEYLKALDDGHAIHTGFDWYSSYNMNSGFSAPWVLPWRKGYKVGGHAVKVMGYDWDKQLLIFQNSFGQDWGDNGKFYIRMSDFFREGIEGAVSVPLFGDNLASFIASHEGKNIKSFASPVIYRVENGKKRPFPSEYVYKAFGGILNGDGTGNYQDVAQRVCDMIPDGDTMSI